MSAAASQDAFVRDLTLARAGDKERLKALAERFLPLVAALTRRFPGAPVEREELYQQGCVGLMKALARYDPAFGASFATYAATLVLGEMRMVCRADAPVHLPRAEREARSRIRQAKRLLTARLCREPTIDELALLLRVEPAELALQMEEITVCSMDATPEGGTPLRELMQDPDAWLDRLLLRDLVSRLPERDQTLLLLRFRLGLTQTETAARLRMTQVQVSRREAAVRACLRDAWAGDAANSS